jgi:hypothetical protein
MARNYGKSGFKTPNKRFLAKQRGFDSHFEMELKDGPLEACEFHGNKVDYIIEHKYEPDFTTPCGKFIIEAKGRFPDSTVAAKYKWIRKCLPEGVELVFLFSKPECPMPHAKRRKDGTKNCHSEWATKNGFRHYTKETIHELLEEAEKPPEEPSETI